MSDRGKWVVIEDGALRLIDAPEAASEQLTAMQQAVGGYIELFLKVSSAHSHRRTIDFYCNEEGRLNGMTPNVLVDAGDGYQFDIVGPVLITAGNADTGDTLPLSKDDLSRLWVAARSGMWPVVRYAR